MTSQPWDRATRGDLHYSLGGSRFSSCSEVTRRRLHNAARQYIEANYSTMLGLLTDKCSRLPFCITESQGDRDGRTRVRVSTAVGQKRKRLSECQKVSRSSFVGVIFRRCPPSSPPLLSESLNNRDSTDSGKMSWSDTSKSSTCTSVSVSICIPAGGDSPLAALSSPRCARPLVSASYDTEECGRLFREMYCGLRGEYCIFYSHGESHCRRILNAMGFKEMPMEQDSQFRPIEKMAIMWCNGINSAAKRKTGSGFYVVNRLRYRGLITNKCSLTRCLKEFELCHPRLVPRGLELASFYPDTVHINGSTALEIWDKIRNQRCLYLLKPGHANCGQGITLHRCDGSLARLSADMASSELNKYTHCKDLVMQRYIDRPLLLNGRKFDLRVYLLVVPNQRRDGSSRGVYAFCHPGYVRLACRPYQLESNDPMLHLTNQIVQQRDPTYAAVKEDTVWSPDSLNDYLNSRRQELGVPCLDWTRRRLYPRIRAVLAHVVSMASSSLCDQPMSFELMGCDFLVDADFNVWLLEINSDPSMNKTTSTLARIVTQAVEEGIALAVEVLQRAARGRSVKRLVCRRDFRKIFSHTNDSTLLRVLAEARVQYPQHAHFASE